MLPVFSLFSSSSLFVVPVTFRPPASAQKCLAKPFPSFCCHVRHSRERQWVWASRRFWDSGIRVCPAWRQVHIWAQHKNFLVTTVWHRGELPQGSGGSSVTTVRGTGSKLTWGWDWKSMFLSPSFLPTLLLLQISGSQGLAVPLSSHPLCHVLGILKAPREWNPPQGKPPLEWPREWIHQVDYLGLVAPVVGTLFH